MGRSATEHGLACWRRTGAEDAREFRCTVLQSTQGSCRCVVVCFACVACGVLCEAAIWPLGHLRCQSLRVLLWIVGLSVVRWVPW